MFVRSIRCSSFAIAKEAHFSELTKPKRVFFHSPAHFSSKSPCFRRNSTGFRRKRTCFLSYSPCFSTKSKEMKYLCRCISIIGRCLLNRHNYLLDSSMKSLRELFRIGYGPSSSHTMGPRSAAEQYNSVTPKPFVFA